MENIYFDLKKLKYLGEGCIIGKSVRIRNPERCIIGDGTIIDDFTYISAEIRIGRYCHIASNVTISGGGGVFTLGDFCGISAGTTVHCATSDYDKVSMDMPSIPKHMEFGGTTANISIGNYSIVGSSSCILPGVKLPDGFTCGAFSLIRPGEYESWSLYVGGHKLKKLKDRDMSRIIETDEFKKLYPNFKIENV